MLDKIIALSLRNRMVVAALAILVAIVGMRTVLRMPIDVLPNLDRPLVTVLTEAPGMVTADVENLVSRPIERSMTGAPGVFRVRSGSSPGLSVVYVEFDWDTDLYQDRQIVGEKLQTVLASLPDAARPELTPVASIMGQVLVVGFRAGEETRQEELRLLIDRDVIPRLESLTGVAQVVSTGSRPTELQVVADTSRMRSFGITLPELRDAIEAASATSVGGRILAGTTAPTVSVPGWVRTAEELASATVRPDPRRPVLIRDVAEVAFGPSAIGVGDGGVDGAPAVLVTFTKQPGSHTLSLTERIEAELDSIVDELPADVEMVPGLFRQADFIERAIGNVLDAMRDGAILVVIILFLFLLSFRTTLVTLTAIPLSLAITALVFEAFGLSINTMTLGGLAVAIGTLVDDAIVDVENVHRRLHENRQAGAPKSVLTVVFEASREIRKPVTYGTLLVTVVYLPLFFLSGIEGRLFAPIGLAYIVSVLASLLVALTVTPVMCSWLLGSDRAQRRYGGFLVRWLRGAVLQITTISLRQPHYVIAGAVALSLCAFLVLATRGATFLPPFNEGTAQVNVYLPPGTSLETSNTYGQRLEQALLAVDGVEHAARRTGRAEGDEHIMPVSTTETILRLDPESERSREEILEDIRHTVDHTFPGLPSETEQPLAHLLSHMLSGVTAQVAIKVSGPDLGVLRDAAERIEAAIAPIEGIRDLFVEQLVEVEQIDVRPDRAAMAQLGVQVDDVADTVELAMGGAVIDRIPSGSITMPITLRLRSEDRRDARAIGDLYVRTLDEGGPVRVTDVAELATVSAPNEIRRENGQRRLVVQHNVSGRALGTVVAEVEQAIAPIRAELANESGYSVRIGGQFEAQREATRVVLTLSVLSLLAMVWILYAHFRSLRISLVVLLTRPIAFLGAVAAVVLSGQTLSIATLVGLIALLGMATRNAILLVDHALRLANERGGRLTPGVMRRAARERVVPVMMTALTSGIGLVPLALSAGEPGRELLYPVATVIIGGLVTNTILDFLVTPGVVWLTCRDAFASLATEESDADRATV